MSSFAVATPLIRPISDLRTNLNDVCEQARESQEPIFMTKNGKSSLVVMDAEAYEQLWQEERLRQKVREVEIEDRYNPQTIPAEAVERELDETLAHCKAL
jgi:prevent-host-death family protein